MTGRQIVFVIYEHCWVTGTHVAILDYSVLFSISLHGDDVVGFDTMWDEDLLSIIRYSWTIFWKAWIRCACVV